MVAMLAAIGAFLSRSAATMTVRAIDAVPVDWQIAVLPGVDPGAVEQAVRDTVQVAGLERVQYADVQAFEATAGDTVQTTGGGKVLGIPPGYRDSFPGQFRLLLGQLGDVLIAQQTAANLHVGPGDTVTILFGDPPGKTVKVAGVVELLNADAMFQAIGVPPGSAPQAPPDNVLILSLDAFNQLVGAPADTRPGTIQRQLHAKLVRRRPAERPVLANIEAENAGRHFEVRTTGSALLANNLAARLEAVREDVFYARLLFVPGPTRCRPGGPSHCHHRPGGGGTTPARSVSVACPRRIDPPIVLLSAAEAVVTGLAGAMAGLLVAEILSRTLFGSSIFVADVLWWSVLSAAIGILLALVTVLLPAWRDARQLTVRAEVGTVKRRFDLWRRIWLDVVLIVVGAGFYCARLRQDIRWCLRPRVSPPPLSTIRPFWHRC